VQLDYPQGGSAALVAALVRGLRKYGGELRLNSSVERILIEGDRAVGVQLWQGEILQARTVVSNASVWDTLKLLPPGNEPYAPWQGLDRHSAAYQQLKQQRAEVMWQALARVVPDIGSRCEVTLVGTPLTHERFLRRHQGSYGPALWAGKGWFPGPQTPIPGLLCCGDSTFPGIGLPAVAASGLIAANSLAPVGQHLELLRAIGCL
jgi:phytoene dehydrogenase-like protein